MRAAYFRGDGVIELAEVPTPKPGDGQLLIRVAGNGVAPTIEKVAFAEARVTDHRGQRLHPRDVHQGLVVGEKDIVLVQAGQLFDDALGLAPQVAPAGHLP